MSRLHGHYSDGHSAARHPATLALGDEGRLDLRVGERVQTWLLPQISISTRVGNTPRRLALPDGGQFETRDNDALDRWLARQRGGREQHWIHRLERRWHWALAALLLCVALIGGGVWWGIPAAAKRIALALPPAANAAIGQGSLEIMDRVMLEPSELAPARQFVLRHKFRELAGDYAALDLVLHFRAGGKLGANAFALPDGGIIVTDELVALAGDDAEVLAVLAHEIGHVDRRHGLRTLLQNSGVALLVAGLLGDLGSITALAAGLPTALVHAGYSRDFEREADAFAAELLRARGIDTRHLASILQKLGDAAGEDHSFFSTHPLSSERLRLIEPH